MATPKQAGPAEAAFERLVAKQKATARAVDQAIAAQKRLTTKHEKEAAQAEQAVVEAVALLHLDGEQSWPAIKDLGVPVTPATREAAKRIKEERRTADVAPARPALAVVPDDADGPTDSGE